MKDSKKKIVFILNPHSGTQSKQNVPEVIAERIDSEKFDYQVRLSACLCG